MPNNPDEQPEAFDPVHRPAHYATLDPEPITVVEGWGLGFCLGNAIKYISRAGRKDPSKAVEDLQKAAWYVDREIRQRQPTEPAAAAEPQPARASLSQEEMDALVVHPGWDDGRDGGEDCRFVALLTEAPWYLRAEVVWRDDYDAKTPDKPLTYSEPLLCVESNQVRKDGSLETFDAEYEDLPVADAVALIALDPKDILSRYATKVGAIRKPPDSAHEGVFWRHAKSDAPAPVAPAMAVEFHLECVTAQGDWIRFLPGDSWRREQEQAARATCAAYRRDAPYGYRLVKVTTEVVDGPSR